MTSSNPRIQSSRNHVDYARTAVFLTITAYISYTILLFGAYLARPYF